MSKKKKNQSYEVNLNPSGDEDDAECPIYVGCCIKMMNQGIHGYVVINIMSGSALNAQD